MQKSGRISAEEAVNFLTSLCTLEMAPNSLFLLLTAASLVLCSSEEQLQGKMETRDGSQCVWFELRKSGRGSVFVAACHCRDEGGDRQSYSCEYEGPMEECEQLLNITKKEFYDMVANSLQSMLERGNWLGC